MSKNITSDKIALIYEFNKKSPLFARAAYQELEAKNYDHALEIIETGIELFPNYATGYLVYAIALARTGNHELALQSLDKGCELIDSDATYDYYLKLIEETSSKKLSPSDSRRVAFFDNETKEEPEKDEPQEEEIDDLEVLANEINNAKIPEVEDEEDIAVKNNDFDFNNTQFISETLAGIYYAQGNLNEAKQVYEKLLEMQPDKAEHFSQKIEEINRKLGSG